VYGGEDEWAEDEEMKTPEMKKQESMGLGLGYDLIQKAGNLNLPYNLIRSSDIFSKQKLRINNIED
jgi:hypothetical protein